MIETEWRRLLLRRCKPLRVINIIGATIVLLANIYVSFNHSIELFRLGGFDGELAYIGVVGAEVTFLLGVLNITVAKLKGVKAGYPSYAGFYLGVTLILWSNIYAGLGAGVFGIILGAATPLSLIIAESIIGRAILHKPPSIEEGKEEDGLLKTALELYEKTGKIPSRRSLMEETSATEWQARQTLSNLKSRSV